MYESVPARLAATVLLARDGAEGLEVFMVVRHHKIEFASGALVFPGGSLDPEDRVIAADAELCDGSLDLPSDQRALRVAALRETFEECGVLLARDSDGGETFAPARRAEIEADAKAGSFGDLLRKQSLALRLDALVPFAHWITPPILPKRFDTHFYIVAAPSDQIAAHDGHESVDSVWISPTRALAKASEGKYTLIFATRLNLQMLAESRDVAEALESARRRKIVTVLPEATKTERGHTLRIPLAAGYGGEVFEI